MTLNARGGDSGQYPNKTPFPNLERALKLSKYDCIMKDCTGTALKVNALVLDNDDMFAR